MNIFPATYGLNLVDTPHPLFTPTDPGPGLAFARDANLLLSQGRHDPAECPADAVFETRVRADGAYS